jgi:hypothetical protein
MQIEKTFHCQFCSLKKYDFKSGTTCGLTNKVPDFNKTCPEIKLKNQILESQIIKINADFEHNKDSKFWVILNLIFFSAIFILLILSGFLFAEYLNSYSRFRLYIFPLVIIIISFSILKIAVGPFNTYRRDNKIYSFEKNRIDSFLSLYGISYVLKFKRNKRIGESLDIDFDFELKK